MSSVPSSYLLPSHPIYRDDLAVWDYDVEAGTELLDEAGWSDHDNDPKTPRQALEIVGIVDGTPLEVTFATTEAALRVEVAELLVESMGECGIGVQLQYYQPTELYLPGPDGLVFGRNFDLAQLAWKADLEPLCSLYLGEQIPTSDNKWLGVNVTGYNNPDYDTACRAGLRARAFQEESYREGHQEALRLFAEELPAVPLYFRLKIAAARPDLCGFDMDITARSDLWNLEVWDYGSGCQ